MQAAFSTPPSYELRRAVSVGLNEYNCRVAVFCMMTSILERYHCKQIKCHLSNIIKNISHSNVKSSRAILYIYEYKFGKCHTTAPQGAGNACIWCIFNMMKIGCCCIHNMTSSIRQHVCMPDAHSVTSTSKP